MKLTDLTKTEFIETIAAVFFRVWAIVMFVNASISVLAQSFNAYAMGRGNVFQMFSFWITQFLISTVVAALLFFFAVPMARNIRQGLSRALDSKP
jgi:hypothetical protein